MASPSAYWMQRDLASCSLTWHSPAERAPLDFLTRAFVPEEAPTNHPNLITRPPKRRRTSISISDLIEDERQSPHAGREHEASRDLEYSRNVSLLHRTRPMSVDCPTPKAWRDSPEQDPENAVSSMRRFRRLHSIYDHQSPRGPSFSPISRDARDSPGWQSNVLDRRASAPTRCEVDFGIVMRPRAASEQPRSGRRLYQSTPTFLKGTPSPPKTPVFDPMDLPLQTPYSSVRTLMDPDVPVESVEANPGYLRPHLLPRLDCPDLTEKLAAARLGVRTGCNSVDDRFWLHSTPLTNHAEFWWQLREVIRLEMTELHSSGEYLYDFDGLDVRDMWPDNEEFMTRFGKPLAECPLRPSPSGLGLMRMFL